MKIPILNFELTFKKIKPDTAVNELDKARDSQAPSAVPAVVQKTNPDSTYPRTGGRRSEPEGISSILGLLDEYSIAHPDYSEQLYEALEYLGKYNPDFSFALDNIVQLGNTPINIYFDDSVSDDQSTVMIAYLKSKWNKYYKYSGGFNTLTNDLLVQQGLFGTISAEMVPLLDLSGLEKVVTVHPKTIRFVYKPDKDDYLPFQVSKSQNALVIGKGGLIELNPLTYKYLAMRRFGEKPYAVPPFLAALDSIVIEKDMMHNFRSVLKKFGMLGFLQVLIRAPQPLAGELDATYRDRCQAYINSVVPEVERGMSNGFSIGFKDMHEFNMQGIGATNISGADQLMQMNDTRKMSGFKQDPLMLGRNFSTTETVGRVIFAKLATQIGNYQKNTASFYQELFTLEFLLAGFKFKSVEVEFDKPLIGDNVRDETAQQLKIANNDALYNQGVISQQQRAQNLGYEEPDQEEPRPLPAMPVNPNLPQGTKNASSDDPTNPKSTKSNSRLSRAVRLSVAEAALGKFVPEFDYTGCSHSHDGFSLMESYDGNKASKKLADYIKSYLTDTQNRYRLAVQKVSAKIGLSLESLGSGASLEQVQDKVLTGVYSNWKTSFSDPQKKIVTRWVTAAYKAFRNDKTGIFSDTKGVPDATFSVTDFRTIDYYRKSDSLYLGKFITDEDTKKKITEFIKKEYVENALPIGKGKAGIKAFREKFETVLQGEDWKVERVINTTVNKMRNSAAVNYMDQAGVLQFRIVGVNDRLQCKYCASMQGKIFSVKTALTRVEKFVQTTPETVREDSPFITSVFKKPEDMENLTAAQLEAAGIALPCYHSSCRDIIVAVL